MTKLERMARRIDRLHDRVVDLERCVVNVQKAVLEGASPTSGQDRADRILSLLGPGLWRIRWNDDDRESTAAVYQDHGGRLWIAPTNWVAATPIEQALGKIADVEEIIPPLSV